MLRMDWVQPVFTPPDWTELLPQASTQDESACLDPELIFLGNNFYTVGCNLI
jgi:hypothetical protein